MFRCFCWPLISAICKLCYQPQSTTIYSWRSKCFTWNIFLCWREISALVATLHDSSKTPLCVLSHNWLHCMRLRRLTAHYHIKVSFVWAIKDRLRFAERLRELYDSNIRTAWQGTHSSAVLFPPSSLADSTGSERRLQQTPGASAPERSAGDCDCCQCSVTQFVPGTKISGPPLMVENETSRLCWAAAHPASVISAGLP